MTAHPASAASYGGELLTIALLSFFLAAGIYHLAFFFRRWRARDNLYFALLCACAALYGATFSPTLARAAAAVADPARLRLLAVLAGAPLYLGLVARLFHLRLGRYGRASALLPLALLPFALLLPQAALAAASPAVSVALAGGLVGNLVWVASRASPRGSFSGLMMTGQAVFAGAMVWDLLSAHGWVPAVQLVAGLPGMFWIGFMAFVVAVGVVTGGNFAEVEVSARTDPLTGLVRRHVFEDALAREAERRRRSGGMLTLLVIDLDHFKGVNDGHGHRVGDEVLARVGHLLRHNARNIDLTCRLGGEEFAVLLQDTDAEGALSFSQRFQEKLAGLEVASPAGAVAGLTASIGIAASSGWVDTGALLDAADDAMYRAKKAGRNRVVTVSLPLEWPGRASAVAAAQD